MTEKQKKGKELEIFQAATRVLASAGMDALTMDLVPMALVVIGGVLFSTLLTLLVVPCAYSLMSSLESNKHEEDLKIALKELGEIP